MNFIICLKGEYLKTKGTFSFWLVLLGGALIPLIYFFVQFFKVDFFVKRAADPWTPLIGDSIGAAITLLFPFFLILVVALNFNSEHKSNAWKKLFVTPQHRGVIYSAKVVFILIQVLFSLLVFGASLLLVGYFLGLIYSQLNFLGTTPDIVFLLKSLAKVFLAFLALIGFQVLLSFQFKNFIIPVAVGFFGIVLGTLLVRWKYSMYNFLSNNVHVKRHISDKTVLDFTFDYPTYQLFSITYFIVFIAIGWFLFNRKAL